ncbi:restriction endonuclease subunit S [Streptomyces sp. NPDC046332]|uniref:restriction endonuclease subunit S n=1 Tax=Streptomyces sp. NPDC046332 TaxID=3155133 RepID=UPI003411DA4C
MNTSSFDPRSLSLPDNYELVRLGYVARLQNGLTVDAKRDVTGDVVTRPYLRVANVQAGSLNLESVTDITVPRSVARRSTLRPGDVLMTEGGDLDKLGRGTVWLGELEGCLHQNHIFAIRPDPQRLDGRFLAYLTQSLYGRCYFESTGTRTTNLASTNSSKIQSFPLPLPPLDEQRRIADFLGVEIAHFDALRQKYQRLQEMAVERAQVIIDESINGHVNVTPLRYLVRFREGPGIMAADFRDAGIPLIRISGLQGGEVTQAGCNFLDPEMVARQWRQFRLKLGDRLVSGSATMGGVSKVTDSTVAGAIPYTGLIILRPARNDVEMDYIEAFMKSSMFTRQIDALKAGATMQHFGPTHLAQIKAPFPGLEEQRAAASRAAKATAFAADTQRMVARQLDLLAERRQALVTAAVTGQLDVTKFRQDAFA